MTTYSPSGTSCFIHSLGFSELCVVLSNRLMAGVPVMGGGAKSVVCSHIESAVMQLLILRTSLLGLSHDFLDVVSE